jgi:hypothetical protein
MARMASADIMCVDSKAVKEKFTGMLRYRPFLNICVCYAAFWTDVHRFIVPILLCSPKSV